MTVVKKLGYELKFDVNEAKKRVDFLDKLRLDRALSDTTESFQLVFKLIPLLLHFNHPDLPGYVANARTGIVHFSLTGFQQDYLARTLSAEQSQNIQKNHRTFEQEAILGVYVMGSIASIAQTPSSDLDIWICHREDLSQNALELLQQKTNAI